MKEIEQKPFNRIGKYCRYYRLTVLEKTLKEVEGSENIKTLSGFEHGRSTNLEHLIKYVKHCESREQKQEFLQGLIKVIEGDSDEQ